MRIGWFVFFSGAALTVACGVTASGEALPAGSDGGASSTSSSSGNTSSSSSSSSSGGADGGDADGEAGGCGADPAPTGATKCPPECAECTAQNVCRIQCTESRKCTGSLTCPPGYACEVTCDGEEACRDTVIACSAIYACSLTCKSKDACKAARFVCGNGSCAMSCAGEACNNAKLQCGAGTCSATCGSGATKPMLTGASASCSANGC